MSSRQMRRLQQLVDASTGADGDDDAWLPSTVKPPSGKSKRSKKKHSKKEGEGAVEEPMVEAPRSPVEEATAPAKQAIVRPAESSDDLHAEEEPQPVVDEAARLEKQQQKAARKKSRKVAQAAKRKQREAEEEALLQAALERRMREVGPDDADVEAGDVDADAVLMNLMMRTDSTRLDMRGERIRNFGATAVEDVGDGTGPRLRADGRARDTGSASFFPEHGGKIKFRASALATPNRYRWPPYDGMGLSLSVVPRPLSFYYLPDPADPAAVHYALDVDSPAYRRADEARLLCAATFAPVQQLVDCLGQHGCYHVPTLLQLGNTLELMGSAPHAQELTDLALYHVGVLMANIRMEGTWAQRLVSSAVPANEIILKTLSRGVFSALRRGCTRTAWEMARLLLSLDPADPEHMLLQIDYTALRARRWVWLLRVHTLAQQRLDDPTFPALIQRVASASAVDGGPPPTLSQHDVAALLAFDISRLPGFAFSAALARHLLEKESAREAADAGKAGGYRSKVLRGMSAAERAMLAAAPSAETLLAEAVVGFPAAAAALVEALQGISAVCRGAGAVDPYWEAVVAPAAQKAAGTREGNIAAAFAARHMDMWKAAETASLLKAVLRDTRDGGDGPSLLQRVAVEVVAQDGRRMPAGVFSGGLCADAVSLRQYGYVTAEEVTGSAATAIPADLLAPNPEEGEEMDMEEVRALMDEHNARDLNPGERDLLLRFVALYGPIPGENVMPPAFQLRTYRERFQAEESVRELYGAVNPFVMFYRTLLPWNSTEEMALRELLQQRGIEDPIRQRELAEMDVDARQWAEEEAAAIAAEDSDVDWQSMISDTDTSTDGYDDDENT